jgi:hypothetical protein
MGVRGGASMRMGAAPPSSAPKSLLAVSGESESEVQLSPSACSLIMPKTE